MSVSSPLGRLHRPPVWFDDASGVWIIRGVEAPDPTIKQTRVVRVLLSAWPGRLTGDELVRRSKVGDAVGCLKRLAQDPLWSSVIILAGKPCVGFKIRHRSGYRNRSTYGICIM